MNRRQMMKSIFSALALLGYVRLCAASASGMGIVDPGFETTV
ncbi:MAG: hypothetical protein AB7T01_08635 [Acidithiobacillus sp.]